MGLQKLKFLFVLAFVSLFSPYVQASGGCEVEAKAAEVACTTTEAQKLIDEAKGAIASATSGSAALIKLKEELGERKAALKAQQKQCASAIKASEAAQAAQQKKGEALIERGAALMVEGEALTPNVATMEEGFYKVQAGHRQKEIGTELLTAAQKCQAANTTHKTVSYAGIGEKLLNLTTTLGTILQTLAALGFDIFGNNNDSSDLASAEAASTDICSSISGADTIACGGGTPDRQTASGSVGSNGSFSGNTVAANTTAAEAAEREASSASANTSSGLASAAGSGGGLGFGGGSAASGGTEEAGTEKASVTTASGSGYFGGGGGGGGSGGGGSSSGKKSSFDRYGLKKRLAKAKTKAEKKKIIAAFNKENQVTGKGRGLASTGKDGKAGPFQDNFQVIRKAHKQNYRSLFHK